MFKYAVGLIIALNCGSVIFLFLVAFYAMTAGGGSVTLDFNRYSEGWWEVGLVGLGALVYPWALWKVWGRQR